MAMLVRLDGATQGRVFLREVEQTALLCGSAILLADSLDDGAGVNALADVERHSRHVKRGMLRLAGPLQLRVQVGVVGVGLVARTSISVR